VLHREIGLNQLKESAPFSFGMSARKDELVLPPSLLLYYDFLIILVKSFFYYIPALLIESGSEPIRSRGIFWVHLIKSLLYLLLCYLPCQPAVGVLIY